MGNKICSKSTAEREQCQYSLVGKNSLNANLKHRIGIKHRNTQICRFSNHLRHYVIKRLQLEQLSCNNRWPFPPWLLPNHHSYRRKISNPKLCNLRILSFAHYLEKERPSALLHLSWNLSLAYDMCGAQHTVLFTNVKYWILVGKYEPVGRLTAFRKIILKLI